MCVCLCKYINVCVLVIYSLCLFVWVFRCFFIYLLIHVFSRLCAVHCVYIYIDYAYVCVCMCVCMCMYVYVCVSMCMYVYVCVCMYLYVCVCMCMYVYRRSPTLKWLPFDNLSLPVKNLRVNIHECTCVLYIQIGVYIYCILILYPKADLKSLVAVLQSSQ
jgi:hypothetical protein